MSKEIDLAVAAFKKGSLVAMPTETVYGLAAPINNPKLIEKIFAVKERPFFDPLIVHVESIEQAKSLCTMWSPEAQLLAQAFWPGPLTFILPKNKDLVSDMITAGMDSVGIRLPRHPVALELIKKTGSPLAAPSANKFTKVSPSRAEHLQGIFSADDVFVLDGGDCEVGIESTIVSLVDEKIRILRPGIITKSEIEKVLGKSLVDQEKEEKIVAPGSHHSHYRPDFPLSFGYQSSPSDEYELRVLNPKPELAARELYSLFRTPLNKNYKACYIQIPQEALGSEKWQAIINRLQRAESRN
jgi:L-threonylcarbamoyladenylate synthase